MLMIYVMRDGSCARFGNAMTRHKKSKIWSMAAMRVDMIELRG